MGQMAAGVAHELNNPLSTILLYTHILGKKLKDRDDLDHDLKLVAEESERCKKIVGNLLDFARQSRVHVENASRARRRAAGGRLRRRDGAAGRAHTSTSWSTWTPGLRADLDRDQMTQVLVNLVKNGVEAMEGRDGAVRVSAHEVEDGGRIHIAVSDEGAGIPRSARDKVFQPFFTTKSIGKGTGLGLPISYGIVKMHNGTIWFDTETGSRHHLPRGASQHPRGRAGRADRRQGSDAMTTPTTVLFVDDDRDFLESKQVYLEARGYRVLTAESPDAALALLERETPAIIFLDLMMEHVDDGFRLGYRIGKDERLAHVPLVMLSGVAAETGTRFDGESGGLREWSRLARFLDKPVTGKQVLAVIEELAVATPAGAPAAV